MILDNLTMIIQKSSTLYEDLAIKSRLWDWFGYE